MSFNSLSINHLSQTSPANFIDSIKFFLLLSLIFDKELTILSIWFELTQNFSSIGHTWASISHALWASFALDMFCFTFSTAFFVSCSLGLFTFVSGMSITFLLSIHIKKDIID